MSDQTPPVQNTLPVEQTSPTSWTPTNSWTQSTKVENTVVEKPAAVVGEVKKAFVDPFLTPKDTTPTKNDQIINDTPVATPVSDTVNGAHIDDLISWPTQPKETASQPWSGFSIDALWSEEKSVSSIDSVLTTLDTSTATPMAAEIKNAGWLDPKKKKMLLIGTSALWLVVLWLVSYLVFTTMFPVETSNIGNTVSDSLQANIDGTTNQWWSGESTNEEGALGESGANAAANAWDSSTYVPGQEPTEDTVPTEDTSAQWFGSNDELPLGSEPSLTDTTTAPTDTPKDTPSQENPSTEIATGGEGNADELSTVTQSPEKVSQELTNKIDQAKQLLALIKSKGNDVDQIKTLALLIKEIKAIQLTIKEGTYTSFTDSVEKPLNDLSFKFDKLTSEIVGQ